LYCAKLYVRQLEQDADPRSDQVQISVRQWTLTPPFQPLEIMHVVPALLPPPWPRPLPRQGSAARTLQPSVSREWHAVWPRARPTRPREVTGLLPPPLPPARMGRSARTTPRYYHPLQKSLAAATCTSTCMSALGILLFAGCYNKFVLCGCMYPRLPYPGYAIQIASYGMRYVGIFAERICVKHP
jgi:hypothetical protein